MAHIENTIQNLKYKHLSPVEQDEISALHRAGHSNREIANLAACLKNVTDVYFARPYASYERGSNEKHNDLLRRYIPKGKAISDYSKDIIKRIYQRLNN